MAESAKVLKKTLLLLIIFYQKAISPSLGARCRFYPSCSNYMYEAIEHFGIIKGFLKGMIRLTKCHPFHRGGCDPVIHKPPTSLD